MHIRRQIYSTSKSTNNGWVIADAGADQTISNLTGLTLDGSGSTTDTSISTYLWEIVSGNGLVIDSPNSAITTISGSAIVGNNVFKLTVIDSNGNTDSDEVEVEVILASSLIISSSEPVSGSGTLDFTQGELNENITLEFTLFNANLGDAVSFDGSLSGVVIAFPVVSVPNKVITLDVNGDASFNYTSTGANFTCEIKITNRDSGEPIPVDDRTSIIIPKFLSI